MNATKQEIHERYLALAKIYHPDHWHSTPKASREMMRRLNEARDYLEE
jgi:curved DNA-binding protein CbpA